MNPSDEFSIIETTEFETTQQKLPTIRTNKVLDPEVSSCEKCDVICPTKCICVDPKRPCGRCEADCPQKCTCNEPLFVTLAICDQKEIKSREVCICKEICLCEKPCDCTCVKCLCQRERTIFIPGTTKVALNERPQSVYFLSQLCKSQQQADDYLGKHRVFELFHFLLCHILANLPANPVEFLLKLLKNILTYSTLKNISPPVLFEEGHLESVYNAMDPMKTGVITINQYQLGLKTLGLRNFNTEPPLTLTGMITRNIFLDEARKRQVWELDDLIEIVKAPEKQKKPKKKINIKRLKNIPL